MDLDKDLDLLLENLHKTRKDLEAKFGPLPVSFMVFWDFDGTLLDGDIGEGMESYPGLMEEILLQGWVPKFPGFIGRNEFWRQYKTLLSTSEEEAYCFMSSTVSHLPPQLKRQIENFARAKFQALLKNHLFSATADLCHHFSREGIDQYIISASPHLFIQGASEILPIPKDHIFGMDFDQIIHYGTGKMERMVKLLEAKTSFDRLALPLLAMGNNWNSDGPMCERSLSQGGLAFILNAGESPKWNLPRARAVKKRT